MEHKIEIIKFLFADTNLFEKALYIRQTVFCEEQKVSTEEEFDNLDDQCEQYLLKYDDKYVVTARKREVEEGIKLERFAVLKEYRKLGLASKILAFILIEIKGTDKTVFLNAQIEAMPLYAKFGFEKIGEQFVEADILHYKMILKK
jgi:predicted GNAT family N-acyltransferase